VEEEKIKSINVDSKEQTTNKRKRGQPKKTILDFPKDWKKIILRGSMEGKSEVELKADLMMSRGKDPESVWGLWLKFQQPGREEEFCTTIKLCKLLSEAWWQTQSRKGLRHTKNTVFETASWFINMKNRFGWKDKSEVSFIDETYDRLAVMTIEEIKRELCEIYGFKRVEGQGAAGALESPKDNQPS